MTTAIDEFARRFWELRSATSIDESTRARRRVDLAWDAVASLQDDVGQLLTRLTRIDPMAFGLTAIALERTHAGSGRPVDSDAEPSHTPLFLIPVLLAHRPGSPLPRQLGVPLPPLPDGRSVPAQVDFLLTWEEVTERLARTTSLRSILLQVREGLEHDIARARLAEVFGSESPKSGMDGFDAEQGRSFSLRFLPAYCLPADKPWYSSFEERSAWQEQAFQAVQGSSQTGIVPYPQTASPYGIALAVAESIAVEGALRLLSREAARVRTAAGHPAPASDVFLFEPFGVPETGIAGHFRVSATPPGRISEPCAQVIVRLVIFREWAFSSDAAAKYAQIARERLGRESRVINLVQDGELLFPELGLHRVHVLLGPSTSATKPVPDVLPLDYPESTDPAHRTLAEFEGNQVQSALESFGKVLADSLGSNAPPTGGRASFTLHGDVWRPVMTMYLHELRDSSGGALKRPLDKALLEKAKSTWCPLGERSWIEVVEAGS